MRSNRLLVVGLLSGLLSGGGALPISVCAQQGAGPAPPQQRSSLTFGAALGLSVSSYEADAANAPNVGEHAVGFDLQTALWMRRVMGVRAAAGVDFFRGPKDQNGHPAKGSFGVASIALALRTPPPRSGFSFGVDLGVSTVFEPTYSYTYNSGNVIFVDGDREMPLRAGPYVEASVRRGGLLGWMLSYRRYFQSEDPDEGRLQSRIVVSFSVSR